VNLLRAWARALGGDVVGSQILCPGAGHSPRDRSLSVTISATSPDGFLAHSHCGDDWRDCRDHVRARLGIDPDGWKDKNRPVQRPQTIIKPDEENADRIAAALHLWNASVDPRGTLAERYLVGRGLELGADIAGDVLRWNPGISAMIALFRSIETDEPRAISRTFLDGNGRKIARKFLGPVAGCGVKLDADENVLAGLHVGEGVETCLAARQLELRPVWALGSAGAIAAFPVLSGIECLTILAERDEASARAVEACAARWHAAGREVLINEPIAAKDLNDCLARTV
jgi:putative DNA primase/helicase